MEKLFDNFKAVEYSKWVEQIEKDLKGKPLDVLLFAAEKEITINAFQNPEEAKQIRFPLVKKHANWKTRKFYATSDNKEILRDLNEGIDCLGLNYQDQASFEKSVDKVGFEFIDADVEFDNKDAAINFKGENSIRLNFDIIAQGIANGEWKNQLSDFTDFFKAQQAHQNIWVNGALYGNSGASTVQELAFTANHLNEYIQVLYDTGIDLATINKSIVIELSITNNYFVNIAKYKVMRYLIEHIFKAYDSNFKSEVITIYATNSDRFAAVNDSNNNLLRQTTQAMSAIIGGCDVLTIHPHDEQSELYNRMAKNISLLLREESYLDKVEDAAEGSYFVNTLCQIIAEKAWELFKSIEQKGGLIKAVETNFIQDAIASNRTYLIEQLNNGKLTFLGVNKYPSTLEDWKDVNPSENEDGVTFKSLQTFKLEGHFKKELHEQSNV
ncbi:methylmalonyl-CoA mutase family protein [Paracrocinitomix mangrovi]|uniref:methylmalonyl-CoA mutase family protein n=1 Tax=Paracrocinitomix mangrovi TaxID=2862509 RepID=UPI001C8EADE3|nr:methylmalonyl-CoA mutase family protein [Paracrocinitomix mangrovi]UKN01667.1 methylmalonyl-CoA mutase family protein [Paracrocinitomix mangrovi]